jgi:hypothetical protein
MTEERKKEGRVPHQHCQRHRQLIIFFIQQPLPFSITTALALDNRKKNPEKVTNKKVERKRRKQEASRRGWHHHQLSLLQNQEPDRARQGVAS